MQQVHPYNALELYKAQAHAAFLPMHRNTMFLHKALCGAAAKCRCKQTLPQSLNSTSHLMLRKGMACQSWVWNNV